MMFNVYQWMILVGTLVAVIKGLPSPKMHKNMQNATSTDCHRPSFKRGVRECCRITKQRIWGNITPSLQACGKKMGKNRRSMISMFHGLPEMSTTMPELVSHSMSESVLPTVTESMSETEIPDEQFTTQAMMKSSYHHKHRKNRRESEKQCFMECVFREENFLTDNNMLDKEAILKRFKSNVVDRKNWKEAAIKAAESCLEMGPKIAEDSDCKSGSAELFACVFKEVFFNCPTWPVNNAYCDSLKEFYEKCPDSPPPPVEEKVELPDSEGKTDAPS